MTSVKVSPEFLDFIHHIRKDVIEAMFGSDPKMYHHIEIVEDGNGICFDVGLKLKLEDSGKLYDELKKELEGSESASLKYFRYDYIGTTAYFVIWHRKG